MSFLDNSELRKQSNCCNNSLTVKKPKKKGGLQSITVRLVQIKKRINLNRKQVKKCFENLF